MQAAEQRSRKNRKPGPGTDKLANAARLGVLEKNLGVPVKRHRDPGGNVGSGLENPFKKETQDKDETVIVMRGF